MLQNSRSYIDVFGFYLKPDIYRAYIVVKDVNNDAVKDSVTTLLDVNCSHQKRLLLVMLNLHRQ